MTMSTANKMKGNDGDSGSILEIHDEKEKDDAISLSSDSICSCSHPSSPSFVIEEESFGPYRLLRTLGISEFGKIKLGIHKTETEQKVAIKLIKKKAISVTDLALVEREIQILRSLRHPHIIKLIEVIETDTYIGVVLEHALRGELFDYILGGHSNNENLARNIFSQLISSVNYMHRKGIVHRDLKLENILFLDTQQTHIVVTNFGFANRGQKADLFATCCGAPTYSAPEVLKGSSISYKGDPVDIWSCGVILYCLVCGYLPFDDDPENPNSVNISQLYRYILKPNTLTFPDTASEDAKDLIRKMLEIDPTKRCSMETIIEHPWMQADRTISLFDIPTEPWQQQQQALVSITTKPHVAPSADMDYQRQSSISDHPVQDDKQLQQQNEEEDDRATVQLNHGKEDSSPSENNNNNKYEHTGPTCANQLKASPQSNKENQYPSSIMVTLKHYIKRLNCMSGST